MTNKKQLRMLKRYLSKQEYDDLIKNGKPIKATFGKVTLVYGSPGIINEPKNE